MAQAKRAAEFIDLLRTSGILARFAQRASTPVPPISDTAPSEIPEQIERLGRLRDAGLITAEEFTNKKTELLERM